MLKQNDAKVRIFSNTTIVADSHGTNDCVHKVHYVVEKKAANNLESKIYFFKLPRATPAPAEAMVKGTNKSPATAPAGSPTKGISTPLATKRYSIPANPPAARKNAAGPTSSAPATTGRRKGAPSTKRGATKLTSNCWLLAARLNKPNSSARGRSFSSLAKSRPFFSNLERTPASIVAWRRSSSRTRRMTLYYRMTRKEKKTMRQEFRLGGGFCPINVQVHRIQLIAFLPYG